MKLGIDNPYRDIWTAIDAENYDWAPDGAGPMGQGKTEREAIEDLIDKLVDIAYEDGWRDAERRIVAVKP